MISGKMTVCAKNGFLPGALAFALSVFAAAAPAAETATPPPKRPSAEPMSRSRDVAPKEEPRKAEAREEPRAPAQPSAVGTWKGTLPWGIFGYVEFTLAIHADMASVTTKSRLGTGTDRMSYDGKKGTWRNGWLDEVLWTLAPAGDGRTAFVNAVSPFGNVSAVFQKISSSTALGGGTRAAPVIKKDARGKVTGRSGR